MDGSKDLKYLLTELNAHLFIESHKRLTLLQLFRASCTFVGGRMRRYRTNLFVLSSGSLLRRRRDLLNRIRCVMSCRSNWRCRGCSINNVVCRSESRPSLRYERVSQACNGNLIGSITVSVINPLNAVYLTKITR